MRYGTLFAVLCTAWACVANVAHAQVLDGSSVQTTLYSFTDFNGGFHYPISGGALVQGIDGDLYGTSFAGGDNSVGTVYKITPAGTLTTLYSFCPESGCPDGSSPVFGLVQAANGDLYGVTFKGGAFGAGTVFKITSTGTLTTLYSFCAESGCPDGSGPQASLVQAAGGGDLFGTTANGGLGSGTIFKITPSGTLTTLYSFTGDADGSNPQATLVEGADGDFYGTTYAGASGFGTIFKITRSGTLTTLHSFNGMDGGLSQAGLLQATNGYFYGTAKFTGAAGVGTIYSFTPAGVLTTLYQFSGSGTDGGWPNSALIQANDGNLYGTAESGGPHGTGGVFKITPGGTLTPLYDFTTPETDSDNLYAGLFQGTNGVFYGTTEQGGANSDGTIFSLSTGLTSFVEPLKTAGKVGANVRILGTDLTGATRVAFNGTAAIFTIVSATEIEATVPTGATTGKIAVKTLGGRLTSNTMFTVNP